MLGAPKQRAAFRFPALAWLKREVGQRHRVAFLVERIRVGVLAGFEPFGPPGAQDAADLTVPLDEYRTFTLAPFYQPLKHGLCLERACWRRGRLRRTPGTLRRP